MDLIMNMRTVFNSCGSQDSLVDKRIGTAFDTVQQVALNLGMLQYIVDNMEAIYSAATHEPILSPVPIVSFIAASYVAADHLNDRYRHVRLNNTISVSVLDTYGLIEVGSWYQFKNTKTTAISLLGGTFNLPLGTKSSLRAKGEMRILKVSATEWDVVGDMEAI
jgi:hypothetical protein